MVTTACITAIVSVILCLCLSNPDASHASSPPIPAAASGNVAVAKTAARPAAVKPGQSSRPLASSATAIRPGQAKALSGLSAVPQGSAWPMIGLGFLLLLSRGRVLGAACR